MTICFITDHPFYEKDGLFYSGGGITADLLHRYVRGDSRLLVLARDTNKPNLTLSSIPNSEFHLLSNYRKPKDIYLKRYALFKELSDYISKCDGVVMRLPSPLGLFAYKICKALEKPCAVEVCGSAYDMYHNYGNIVARIIAPFSERIHKKVIFDSDFVLYVTQECLQKEYPYKPTARTVSCSNVSLPIIDNSVLDERLDRIGKHNGKSFVFGQIGNVSVAYKGYEVMLNAMDRLKKSGLDIQYHIVGGGNPDSLIEKAKALRLERQLVFRGHMDHSMISEFLREIDIYVHPSFQEGVPRSAIEAISHAVPVLISNAGGSSELVSKEWIHKPGDVEKLVGDILKITQNKELQSLAACENFERGKDYYADILNSKRSAYYDSFFQSL